MPSRDIRAAKPGIASAKFTIKRVRNAILPGNPGREKFSEREVRVYKIN
jgi:hypothetical protein